MHVGGGREPSSTFSRSLGTSWPQLEPLMALLSTGRVGAGSRVCAGAAVLSEGILSILGPREESAPAVLVVVTACWEVTSKLLDLSLSLGMVARGQAYRDP